MMDGNERFPRRDGKPFCKAYPNEQRADKTRGKRYGNRVYIRYGTRRIAQRFCNDTAYCLCMTAGGDLRHNTAVELMLLKRRGDHI